MVPLLVLSLKAFEADTGVLLWCLLVDTVLTDDVLFDVLFKYGVILALLGCVSSSSIIALHTHRSKK